MTERSMKSLNNGYLEINELSHASVANIYKKELADAIDAVKELERVLK